MQNPVQNILIEPVRGTRNWVCNAPNNYLLVESIQIVLVDQKFMTKTENFDSLGKPNKSRVTLGE